MREGGYQKDATPKTTVKKQESQRIKNSRLGNRNTLRIFEEKRNSERKRGKWGTSIENTGTNSHGKARATRKR